MGRNISWWKNCKLIIKLLKSLSTNDLSNKISLDIRLDWKTFIISPNDHKLIDLNVYYGNPFPTLDENGKEIVDDVSLEEQLIKVVLEEHHGNEVNALFSILNTQLVGFLCYISCKKI